MVDSEDYPEAKLLGRLGKIAQINPNVAVIVRGDGATPYEHIVHVLNTCKKARVWNVSFMTVDHNTRHDPPVAQSEMRSPLPWRRGLGSLCAWRGVCRPEPPGPQGRTGRRAAGLPPAAPPFPRPSGARRTGSARGQSREEPPKTRRRKNRRGRLRPSRTSSTTRTCVTAKRPTTSPSSSTPIRQRLPTGRAHPGRNLSARRGVPDREPGDRGGGDLPALSSGSRPAITWPTLPTGSPRWPTTGAPFMRRSLISKPPRPDQTGQDPVLRDLLQGPLPVKTDGRGPRMRSSRGWSRPRRTTRSGTGR